MRIQHNIPGMRTLRSGRKLNNDTAKTLEKLSSGYCINRAGDDAAGLAVSERIRMNLTEFGRCKDNIQEGIDLANTADAALQEVNDMLNRAQELCTMAANGTYSEHERDELQKELDALYSEVDRIFESSRFNEVQLFRHESRDPSEGYYAEVECVIPSDELLEWGELANVESRPFDQATPAVGSSVTVTPDSNVDPNDVSTLDGKSVNIGGTTYFFDYDQSNNSTDLAGLSGVTRVDISACSTVDDALDELCDATNGLLDKEGTKVNDDGTITFQMAPTTLYQEITADGDTFTYPAPESSSQNGTAISSLAQKALDEVDSSINTVSYNDSTIPLTLISKGASETIGDDLNHLLQNSLQFYRAEYGSSGTSRSITFTTGTGGGTVISISANMTVGELRDKIITAINDEIDNFSVTSYDASTGAMNITCTANGKALTQAYVYEYRPYSGGNSITKNETVSALNVETVCTQAGTAESVEKWTVSLPSSLPDGHFSFKVGSSQYLFYNSSKFEEGYTFLTSNVPYGNYFDIAGMSKNQVYEKIKGLISTKYNTANVSLSGNKITLSCTAIGQNLNVSVASSSATLQTYKSVQSGGYATSHVLTSTFASFKQDYSLQMDLSEKMSGTNPSGLYGTGFAFAASYNGSNYTWYEFSDGNNQTTGASSSRTGAKQVDISACRTYSEVAAALQTAMGTGVKVEADDTTGILTISGSRSASSNFPSFKEGVAELDGLFTEDLAAGQLSNIQTVNTANGTDAGHSMAEIDFSGYDSSNFNELHGKGFRVTCATCSGEYINVVFCYDKGHLDFPKSFDEEDKSSGEMRTIHNLVVELKDMTDGSDIVQAIVEQLTPELDHYTGVEAGTPASVLKVFDKRQGDIFVDDNQDGKADQSELRQAQILSGVRTNFIYTTREQFVPYVDDHLGDIDITLVGVKIYTNSESDNQYVDIHLPYLTLENLKMNPPEPDLSTVEAAAETLERANAANNVISYVRGTLGADSNRLEHAYADLAQAEEQAADAYSRIRDTDMAEMMMEQTKLSILMQAQQAAQTHTMQQPQAILKLMQ